MKGTYEEKTVSDNKNRDRFFIGSGINRFGERLKAAMDAKGITSNVKMGEKCGMSDTVIRNYLIGKTYPTLDRLSILAYELDCSPTWLLCGVDVAPKEGEHKKDEGNINYPSSELPLLQMLSETQRQALTGAILEHGVSGIITALNGMAELTEFLKLSENERAQALRVLAMTKKGAGQPGGADSTLSPPSDDKRQAS